MALALDREERAGDAETIAEMSAVQSVESEHSVPVISVVGLTDVLEYARTNDALTDHREAVAAYRSKYGIIK